MTAATAPAARRALRRVMPRRRRASSCFRASSPQDAIAARRLLRRPRRLRCAADRVQCRTRAGPRSRAHRRHRRVADARSDARVGGGAGAADVDRQCRSRASSCTVCCLFGAASSSTTCAACSARRSGRRDRAAGAGPLRAPLAARRRIRPLPVPVGRTQARAGARRERRAFSFGVAARQGRADPHRPFRQLGSGDGRRHPELSRGPRPLPFRPPPDQAALARCAGHPALQPGPASASSRKRGSLDAIVSLLERGDVVVFPFDQYAGGADGIDVEFFGQPAGTFKSLAVIALSTGAPVMPAACWREPDGRHVLRFEDAGAARRRRQRQRVDPPHDARVQRGDRATGAAPSGAMVVGAPPLEVGAPQAATQRSARQANGRGRPTYKVDVIPASARGSRSRDESAVADPLRRQPLTTATRGGSCRYRCIKPA